MKRRNLAGAFIAAVAGVLVAAVSAAADPAADPGAVQTLTPPSKPSTPALDESFLADLTRAGMTISDVPTAIAGAHATCAYLAGHTAAEAVEQGQKVNPTMTREDEIAYVDAAIAVYCPQQRPLTGALA
jgi:Protein of unknown function (DUF732)